MVENLQDSDLEDIEELIDLANRARSYLESHHWCKKVQESFLDLGWGYMLAVFYFRFEPSGRDIPDSVRVVIGDLPPAYIDAEDNPTDPCALEGYVHEMQKWADHVNQDKPVDELIPVNVPPEKEWAMDLQSRLDIIRKEILPEFNDELVGCGTFE